MKNPILLLPRVLGHEHFAHPRARVALSYDSPMIEVPVEPPPTLPPKPTRRLGLSWLDAVALQRFVDGDESLWTKLVEQVTAVAWSLTGGDRDDARVRLLARAIATERARQIIFTDQLDGHLRRRDEQAVALIERTLLGTTRRLVLLLAEHRRACERLPRRVSISVGTANNVMVAAGR